MKNAKPKRSGWKIIHLACWYVPCPGRTLLSLSSAKYGTNKLVLLSCRPTRTRRAFYYSGTGHGRYETQKSNMISCRKNDWPSLGPFWCFDPTLRTVHLPSVAKIRPFVGYMTWKYLQIDWKDDDYVKCNLTLNSNIDRERRIWSETPCPNYYHSIWTKTIWRKTLRNGM